MSEATNYIPEVRKQYEEFPYPERNPADELHGLHMTYISRADAVNHFCFKGKQNFGNFRVLIAGGGTGDNLISWAEQLRHKKNSEVTYLDMSTASGNIAKKRAEIRKLSNVKFINDSILNVPDLNLGKFDFIDCCGVLHHLKDPDAGLKALQSVLKPTGAMSLMVYAPYGRTGIYMIQNLMRLVNGTEEDPRIKVNNTKAILKTLPQYHGYLTAKKLGLITFSDEANDAGLYDMFLHTQDRAYTILEVHDWLENCGLKMTGEPGNNYMQEEYLPESYISDPVLLKLVKSYPLKVQQAIAESISNRLAKHEFFAIHKDAPDAVATPDDQDLVLSKGLHELIPFEQLAALSAQHKDSFTATFDKLPGQPKVFVPKGKFIQQLLLQVDNKRTVREILDGVRNSPVFNKNDAADETALMQDFGNLFTSLTRGYVAFLRDKSVPPFITPQEIQDNLVKSLKK